MWMFPVSITVRNNMAVILRNESSITLYLVWSLVHAGNIRYAQLPGTGTPHSSSSAGTSHGLGVIRSLLQASLHGDTTKSADQVLPVRFMIQSFRGRYVPDLYNLQDQRS